MNPMKKPSMLIGLVAQAVLFIASTSIAHAEDGDLADHVWLQIMSGAVFSPNRGIGPHDAPTLDLAPTDLRVGLTLDCLGREQGILRGNTDIIAELSVWPIFEGFGDIVVGPAGIARYNFVQPGSQFVPYVQAGAGIVYTDAYQDRSQRAIGQAQEFTLQAGVGLHYLLSQTWSVSAEADYLHVSNADLSSRNAGVNALGGMLGVTYRFGKCVGRPMRD
jgi:hypothetical protein